MIGLIVLVNLSVDFSLQMQVISIARQPKVMLPVCF